MLTNSGAELFFDCVVSTLLPFMIPQMIADITSILGRYR